MQLARPATEVVERVYDVDIPTQPWLESIRSAAERSFAGHMAVQAYTFHIRPDGRFDLGEIASEPAVEALLRRAHALADPDAIRQIYLRRPLQSLERALAGHQGDSGYQEVSRSGIGNITLALGVDPGGAGCALVFLQREARILSRPTRQALERISAHLGSARRLRGSLGGPRRPTEVVADADAIMGADGAVLHAERDARDPEARRALREAARRIDRARSHRAGMDATEMLGLWRALVDGRWSLIERFDSDGRRIFVARRNDPTARKSRVLNDHERKLLALLALGHSLKLCAYELGLAQSTVSALARSAMRKLGVRSRAELVELHGAIVSAAERDANER